MEKSCVGLKRKSRQDPFPGIRERRLRVLSDICPGSSLFLRIAFWAKEVSLKSVLAIIDKFVFYFTKNYISIRANDWTAERAIIARSSNDFSLSLLCCSSVQVVSGN